MKKRKTVKITTSMFELQMFWNSGYVSAQIAILIGLLSVRLFAQSVAVKRFCLVILLFDILLLVYLLMRNASVVVADTDSCVTKEKEKLDVSVTTTAASAEVKDKQTSGSKHHTEIHNKVGVPTVEQETVKTDLVQQSIGNEHSADVPNAIEEPVEKKVKNVEEMTAEDWAAIFNMDN